VRVAVKCQPAGTRKTGRPLQRRLVAYYVENIKINEAQTNEIIIMLIIIILHQQLQLQLLLLLLLILPLLLLLLLFFFNIHGSVHRSVTSINNQEDATW